jgi:hypothetical protein
MAANECTSCGGPLSSAASHQASGGPVCQGCALKLVTEDIEVADLIDGMAVRDGSYGRGFLATFTGGIVALLLISATAKGTETIRGAKWGFLAHITLLFIVFTVTKCARVL